MRSKRHIALGSMCVLFSILAICMNYFIDEGIEESGMYNSHGICINEVCGDYFPTSFVETQPASDWIELYNYSDESINLAQYYLSDDKDDLYKCNLPPIELMPNSYYVIHSDSDEMIDGEEQLNFRINAQGETLYLSYGKSVIDIVDVPAMDANTAWSRLTDAGAEWGNTELTYGLSNNGAKRIIEKIDAPVFSAVSGFYADEFELELKAAADSRIYYTLDGSNPDIDSFLYEEPILVRDVSEEPNIYSARDDFNLLHESAAEREVDKITIVRAIAIDAAGRKSDIVTSSYIIGKDSNQAYSEMYTVSLVTDPYNLFDYNEGIYVLGKSYDDYAAQGDVTDDWIQTEANYRNRGKNSERPANIEIFNENGDCILDKEVGIRIHGGTTRGCAQKSFSVYARKMYNGEDTIEGLFGEDTIVHKFFIYTNREGTKLRDVLASTVLADRDMAVQSFIYCNVFLDGEYWGIYLLAEVYDEYYYKNNYGIEADNIQIFEGISPPDVGEYLMTVPDKSEASVYEKLCRMIDIQSFIDYYAAMLYLNNNDWISYNARCYRSIEIGSGENEDGKWRWGVWDIETAMYDADVNTFHVGNLSSWEDDPLAQTLMKHEEFRKQFVLTYMDLYNNIRREDNILPIIYEMENNIAESYAMHIERYYDAGSINEYTDKLETFFMDRSEYVFEHVKEEFQLSADPAWLVILSNKDGAASFRVNTSLIDMPEAWWQGLYFPDYPVEIKIEEIYGNNTFLGWYTEDGVLLSTEDVITVNLNEGINSICPKFEAE